MIKHLGLFVAIGLIFAGSWLFVSNISPFFSRTNTVVSEKTEPQPVPTPVVNKTVKEKVSQEQVLYPTRPRKGEEIGELYIPNLDATLPIFHGTEEDELEKGVGHFAGSVLPGENDNSVLSGHRDTVFRKLGEVGQGDLLIVRTSAGEFTYKVRKVRIVDADDRTVIVPKPRATLTVTTCYPFSFIGDAPERYILVANLVTET